MIHLLPNCSPAEVLFLLHARHTPPLRQLLRVTFLDLLRQQVLRVEQHLVQPHPRDPATWQQHVVAGPTLPTYVPLPHEHIFVQIFQYDASLRVPFRQYVKLVVQKLPNNAATYYRQLLQNEWLGQQFDHAALWRRLFSWWRLTRAGVTTCDLVQEEVIRLDAQLHEAAKTDVVQAQQLMQELGGFLFVLPTYTSDLGRQVEREIQMAQPPVEYNAFGGGDFTWHDCADSFDSHCGHADGHGGHGCGGDSGCSGCSGDGGCSGCSGCGGCGGD